MMSDTVLETFTIYAHPADLPTVPYVVRMFDVGRGREPIATDIYWTAQTLRLARMWVPMGAVRLDRSPEDHPTVVESWI
jgi:hypothetical protein